MKSIHSIHSFDKIKLLADSRRMEILRLLMESPATLTHLARALKQSPAWVRHHILALQSAELIEVGETRRTGKVTEKFYRAKAGAFILQEIVLPNSKKPVFIFSGSHDLAIEGIAEHLSKHVTMLNMPVGSLDGLVNLRQGLCQISGSHLLDESGEYNTPFIKHLFPDRAMEVVTLAYRTQGLMIASGNPRSVKKISDLARGKIQFVNRNAGSGTRLWLDTELRKLKIPAEKISGYENTVKTHSEAAEFIAQGKADASIGLQAAANQHGLDFIPLFEERYDLVLPREHEQILLPLLDYLQTSIFRSELNALTGYNTAHSGEQVTV
jgi:putative molybdopterin biosynthesis protein